MGGEGLGNRLAEGDLERGEGCQKCAVLSTKVSCLDGNGIPGRYGSLVVALLRQLAESEQTGRCAVSDRDQLE